MAVAIEFRSVTKSFGANRVIDNVSLVIDPGEIFFLLGPSGCGKTTLLRCLAGFYTPDEGRVFVDGKDVTDLAPEDRDMAMVFQSYALWPHMSVRQNVAFGLELRKVTGAELERRVDEALDLVHMTDRARHMPNQLSGGQQQRVALARALVVRPRCLLLDEPLSNLDAKLRHEMRAEIRRICKKAGLTAVYVTHDQKEALSISDRLAVLDRGVIQQCGPPRDVYRFPTSRFVANFIGETNFVEGTIASAAPGRIEIDTAAGRMVSTQQPVAPGAPGDRVVLSIRPEVIHLTIDAPPDVNAFAARVHDSIYLGEMAQHEISLPPAAGRVETDAPRLKVYDLNPKIVARNDEVKSAMAWFRPDNVVVLRE